MSSVQPIAAAIDIGSNSIKMTVARLGGGERIEELAWWSETVRLGTGLDATGRLADDRIEAAMAALRRFASEARALGAVRIVGVATEATRMASNGRTFLDRVERETQIDVRVIDGDEEAALTFRGVAASTDVSGRVVVVDIGGASTELIVAEGGAFREARSIPLGSGRLTDREVPDDPPSAESIAACRELAVAALRPVAMEINVPTGVDSRLIVVGGTGEFLAGLMPDSRRIGVKDVVAVLGRLQRESSTQIANELGIQQARARVLPAGVAIVAALTDLMAPFRIDVARSGIRAGLLLDMVAVGATPRASASGMLGESETHGGGNR